MRLGPLAVLFLLCGPLSADVLVLKDGSRVGGRLVDKGSHYEITTDGGLRTFLKDEVDKVLKDPRELLGDADRLLAEAKAEYQRAVELSDLSAQGAAMKETALKLSRAREITATTRDLFPEDKYSDLDTKLVQIMQLMRLVRERVGSEIARRPGVQPPALVNGPSVSSVALEEAFSILTDPARRADPAQRAKAREGFRTQRAFVPDLYEVATAAMLFLSRSDAEWKIDAPTQAALQDYFSQPWLRNPRAISPAQHQAAAAWVTDKIAGLKKASEGAPVEPIALFGIGHLGHAPAGKEQDRTARLLGLSVQNGIPGTPEGFAVRDMNSWIAAGDFDLAVLSFIKEHRATDTPIVRFVWSYALLRLVLEKKRGWDRPASALATVTCSDQAGKDHVAALIKSIRTAASCNQCLGAGKLRCTNCHGKTEQRWDCDKCKGSGKVTETFGGGFRGETLPCYPCRGRGFMKLIRCEKCRGGYNDCRQCEKEKAPPELGEICEVQGCGSCESRGYVFKKILWACKACMGLGLRLTPRQDPLKVLP